jgi:hypothetical protein
MVAKGAIRCENLYMPESSLKFNLKFCRKKVTSLFFMLLLTLTEHCKFVVHVRAQSKWL